MTNSCGIKADADLLGLGVRLGSYLQWLALIWAGIAAPNQIAGVVKSISTFQFAFLVAIIWTLSAGQRQSYDIEVFILTAFGAGGGLSVAVIIGSEEGSRLTRALVTLLLLAFSSCNIFFWTKGLHMLHRSPCSWIFIFAKVDMHGPVRYFGIVTSVLTGIGSLGSLVKSCVGLSSNWSHRSSWLLSPPHQIAHPHEGTNHYLHRLAPVAQLLTLVTLVLVVELTVTWNNITGINSVRQTGQLIPLILGSGAVLQVTWASLFRPKPNYLSSSSYALGSLSRTPRQVIPQTRP